MNVSAPRTPTPRFHVRVDPLSIRLRREDEHVPYDDVYCEGTRTTLVGRICGWQGLHGLIPSDLRFALDAAFAPFIGLDSTVANVEAAQVALQLAWEAFE